jgi:hypothetical protein
MTEQDLDLPTRSADGLAALDIFYSDFNEINFYVEDIDQENLYEVLLRKLFPDVRIERIFPLGGKPAILRHARSSDNAGITSFRAYILDKDFDDFLENQVSHPNIFYLDRFCIENHILEEDAFVEVVIESQPKKRRQDVVRNLEISNMTDQIFSALRPLFICFACVQRFQLGLTNCGCAPETYCINGRLWEIDQQVFRSYIDTLVEASLVANLDPPIDDPISDERLRDICSANNHSLICGKYVVAMLFHYIKSKYKLGNITFDSFVFRVAKSCSLVSLADLGRRISEGAEAHGIDSGMETPSVST